MNHVIAIAVLVGLAVILGLIFTWGRRFSGPGLLAGSAFRRETDEKVDTGPGPA